MDQCDQGGEQAKADDGLKDGDNGPGRAGLAVAEAVPGPSPT